MPFCPNCDRRLHEGKCSRCDAELPDAPATTKASQPRAEAESEQSGAPLMFASLLTSSPAVELEPEAASLAVATETAQPEPLSAASSASIAVATKASRDNAGSSDGPAVQRDQLGSLPRLNTGELDSLIKAEAAAIAKAADVKQAVLRIYGDHFGGKVALWVGLFGTVDEHAQDEFIDSFVATAIGVTVDRKRSMSRKSSGTKYTCHPLKGGLYDGAVCTWTDQDFFGAVVSLSGITVRETIKLAQASWDR
jgi:hypothetical protein